MEVGKFDVGFLDGPLESLQDGKNREILEQGKKKEREKINYEKYALVILTCVLKHLPFYFPGKELIHNCYS